jgi:hypothetical protein
VIALICDPEPIIHSKAVEVVLKVFEHHIYPALSSLNSINMDESALYYFIEHSMMASKEVPGFYHPQSFFGFFRILTVLSKGDYTFKVQLELILCDCIDSIATGTLKAECISPEFSGVLVKLMTVSLRNGNAMLYSLFVLNLSKAIKYFIGQDSTRTVCSCNTRSSLLA